jgi:hypothetical protein
MMKSRSTENPECQQLHFGKRTRVEGTFPAQVLTAVSISAGWPNSEQRKVGGDNSSSRRKLPLCLCCEYSKIINCASQLALQGRE